MMKQQLKTLGLFIVGVSATLPLAQPAAAIPALGNFDTTFNTTGTVITPIGTSGDTAVAVAVQPDARIVVAGTTSTASGNAFAVVRYNADGTLDTGFNASGMTTVDFGSNFAQVKGEVVQPDGKIVVAGDAYIDSTTGRDFAIVRFNSDGTLDASFGSGGKVTTDIGSTGDYAGGLALQADGKLVVSGYRQHAGGGFDYALVRYNTDGSLDTGFGTGGQVITALGTNNDWAVTVTLQPDGKILIGSAYSSSGADFFVARYTTDGVLDTTFSPSGTLAPGTVTTDLGGNYETVNALLVQPDGKIVAAGLSGTTPNPSDIALVRYNADGSLDTSFGESANGKETTNPNSGSSAAYAVALQPNGKIIAAGYSNKGSDNDFALIRFTSAGIPESAQLAIGSTDDGANAIALQPDGRIVAAGYASNGTDNDFAVVRYVSNDAPWDTAPDAFSFSDVTDVAKGSVQTSNMITVAGLDSGVSVPVTVSNGAYAKNGFTTYTTDPGWVQNGDTLNVRHIAASADNQTINTVLTVGGVMPTDNLARTLGTTTSDTFSSTTAASISSSTTSGGSGGGAFGPGFLVLLIVGGWRKLARS